MRAASNIDRLGPADAQSLRQRRAQREHGIREIGVRQRAMGDGTAPRLQKIHIRGGQKRRVRDDASPPEQSKTVETFGIAHAMSRAHVSVFPIALGAMRLHGAGTATRQRPEFLEQRVSAAGDKARRDDAFHPPGAIVGMIAQMLDDRARPGHRAGHIAIAIIRRAVVGMIHGDLADERAQAFLDRQIAEQFRRVVDERAIDAPREGEIAVARLERKRVRREPVGERQMQRGAELRILRCVNVQIDEARQNVTPRADLLEPACGSRLVMASRPFGIVARRHVHDRARRIDLDERILEHLHRAAPRCVEKGAANEAAAKVMHGKPL